MSSFPFLVTEPLLERREGDRRHSGGLRRMLTHPMALFIFLMTLGVLAWQWRYVVYEPLWLVRSHSADRSDFYMGKTNGIANKALVQQARNYLTDVDHLDASGNITSPENLRLQDVHLSIPWFIRHAPDSVDFNPFIKPGGRYVVSWLYVPGCQKTVWKSHARTRIGMAAAGSPAIPSAASPS